MTYALNASVMARAAGAAGDASAEVRGADSAAAYSALAAGLPGSTTAELSGDLSDAMTTGISGLSDDLASFGENLQRTADDGVAIDEASGGIFNLTRYILTGQ